MRVPGCNCKLKVTDGDTTQVLEFRFKAVKVKILQRQGGQAYLSAAEYLELAVRIVARLRRMSVFTGTSHLLVLHLDTCLFEDAPGFQIENPQVQASLVVYEGPSRDLREIYSRVFLSSSAFISASRTIENFLTPESMTESTVSQRSS